MTRLVIVIQYFKLGVDGRAVGEQEVMLEMSIARSRGQQRVERLLVGLERYPELIFIRIFHQPRAQL